ncbi:hypothetical protein JX266_000952 [Neoarthrinium moseri]|uniref:uncharacterized protein n=1 Tax=Neoarthrinium moseri TaxID=1658444 RepID=UPI001FDC0B7C|nr:uncharacterized protein JN550_000287 [Neoarthrinium moseri]KAI1854834.1 hypothetical protein JX266_000952 [Neoarthrinium moseri]KAI1878105.1 hypothetical protein JN550_000287 [Neoarthrinium moseri]
MVCDDATQPRWRERHPQSDDVLEARDGRAMSIGKQRPRSVAMHDEPDLAMEGSAAGGREAPSAPHAEANLDSESGPAHVYAPVCDMPELDNGDSTDDHLDPPPMRDAEMRRFGLSDDVSSLHAPSQMLSLSSHRRAPKPFDDGATFNSNRSLAPQDTENVWENDRRYCGHTYYMPNDKVEQDRLLLVHEVYKSAFGDEPTTIPLENPSAILDVGAATGEWAIDLADRFPDCEVTGFDISDIFPRFVAPNLFWEVDNAELEWLRPSDTYDLVHFRDMAGAFADWPFVYQQAFKVCKPGGWIELSDKEDLSNVGQFPSFFGPDSVIHKTARDWKAASVEAGRPVGIHHLDPQLLRDAGFVDVNLSERVVPISPRDLETGHLFLKALLTAIESSALRLLTKYKGYTADEVRNIGVLLQEEMKGIALDRERSKGFVVKFIVLTGRKPDGASFWETDPSAGHSTAMDIETNEANGGATCQVGTEATPGDMASTPDPPAGIPSGDGSSTLHAEAASSVDQNDVVAPDDEPTKPMELLGTDGATESQASEPRPELPQTSTHARPKSVAIISEPASIMRRSST